MTGGDEALAAEETEGGRCGGEGEDHDEGPVGQRDARVVHRKGADVSAHWFQARRLKGTGEGVVVEAELLQSGPAGRIVGCGIAAGEAPAEEWAQLVVKEVEAFWGVEAQPRVGEEDTAGV
jgi:hypothetical protein